MYNLFYWSYSPQLMCTFSSYDDCQKALNELKTRYPDAKIWWTSVTPVNSYEEWKDRWFGVIRSYKDSPNIKKIQAVYLHK